MGYDDNDSAYLYNYGVVKERTEKAILIPVHEVTDFLGEELDDLDGEEIWVPLSLVESEDDEFIELPHWFVRKNILE